MFRYKDIYITNFDYERLEEMLNRHIAGSKIEVITAKNLTYELNRAKKIDSKNIPPDYVTMNSVLELKNLAKPDMHQFRLVFPEDADPENGKLSVLAPIGSAVLGYRQGEVVKCDTSSGEEYFQIEKIIYQPEAAGDFNL